MADHAVLPFRVLLLTPSAAGDRPNILLVMTDQQPAASLGGYGNPVARTPVLDSLAAAGILVENPVCNYPACTPARATVMTGRYPHTTRVRANHLHLPDREITLPDMLRRAGYETALVGKNHVFPDGNPASVFRDGWLALRDWPKSMLELREQWPALSQEIGYTHRRDVFDHWFQADHFGPAGPGFADVREYSLRPPIWRANAGSGVSPFPAERTATGVLAAEAERYIREPGRGERPWFMWLSFPDPHNPYLAPEPFASMFDPEKVELPPVDSLSGKPERQRIARHMNGMDKPDEWTTRQAVAIQHAMVTAIDTGVGRVLEALRETDQERRTVVVYTSDHGGYVGDHGAWHKALAFYDSLVRVPLLISWPGTLPAARLGGGLVEEVDLMPTLLDLAGAETPPGVQGASYAAALTGDGTLHERAYAEAGEAGDPVGWDDLPFHPESPTDDRYFPWDGFQEAWVGQGKMVRTVDWKYTWYATGEEELYDLKADPDELDNLAGDPSSAGRLTEFRDDLLRWTVATEDQLPLHAANVYLEDAVENRLPF